MNELGKKLFLAVCAVRGIASERAELEWAEWEGDFMTQEQWQQTAEYFLAEQSAQKYNGTSDHRLMEMPAHQEPYGWIGENSGQFIKNVGQGIVNGKALYTAPPQRKPLTEGEIEKAYTHIYSNMPNSSLDKRFAWVEQGIRYAETAHGIKEQT